MADWVIEVKFNLCYDTSKGTYTNNPLFVETG